MSPDQLVVHTSSLRAKKAVLGSVLRGQTVQFGLLLAMLVAVIGGSLLVGAHMLALGLLVAGFGAWPLMLLIWYRMELRDLPPVARPASVDGVLSGDVLAGLPHRPSPQQIAEAALRVSGGRFFMVRFGLDPSFVIGSSSTNPDEAQAIWARASELMTQFALKTIDAPILVAALVEHIPNADQSLAHLKISTDDIIKGAAWYEHILAEIAAHKAKKATGGIGRDWSFGYTPLLAQFAQNITNSIAQGGLLQRDIEGHQEVVKQIMSALSGGGRQNVALIGPHGSGKTTIIYGLAEELLMPKGQQLKVPKSLEYRQVMALDPGSLIAKARGRGELEGLVQALFVEALKAKNVILFLDDAELFLEEGTGSVDLSNLLLPVLEGGALRLVLAMDEQRWLRLAQRNPGLAQYLNRINVEPPGKDDTMLVLEDQLMVMEYRYKVVYTYQSLNEAYRLGDRYVQDQAMPGKAITLLEAAAQLAENGLVTARSVQQAVERSYGIKVGNAEEAQERATLLNLEELIHQRMINQKRAVGVVANALRRARAGVRNQDRPIGAFLFLGPTGVGKTELAKSLAAVYFGGEDRLVRVDLNEFSQPQDVTRLIADGAQDKDSLTAQISRQPFSVVLLDEIEKAHPNVLNTLLQLLDEGVLRDINNRPVSFRDAIIIATSNAGADRVRQYIDAGQQLEQFEEPFVNWLIDSGQFKPEFLNRFDEIVVFRPLEPAELLQVVDLIIAGINKTLATQRISVQLADDAKKLLVQTGYDPRLGARPMRRVVQRAVEDLVAKRVLAGEAEAGSVITVSLEDVRAVLSR